MAKYRRKTSFISKDPAARAKQLANLKRGKDPGTLPAIIKKAKKLQEVNIIEFATDPLYLGLSFKERPAQEVILRVVYGLPLNDDQLKIYRQLTKNKKEFESGEEKTEAVLALGARSGKSLLASIVAIYEATRSKWQKYLNKGESGYVVVVSTRQKQSEQIIGANCQRLMENSYNLKGFIKDSTQSELTLKNNMKIISLPCNSTAGRGLPIACLIFDEIAHFYTEGVKADEVIFNALRPRQVQFPGCRLIMISTPAAKQGIFFSFFDEGFKTPGRLTAQAPTLFMNPLVDQKFLEKEKARDIDAFSREFEAQFAEKMESFFSFDLLNECFTLSGDQKFISTLSYTLGIDASGLAGRDLFGLAISHRQGQKIIIDYAKSFNTKNLDVIINEIENLKKNYNLKIAVIDRFAKGFVKAFLQKLGLIVLVRPSLADIYVNFKSLAIAGNLTLPISKELKSGLMNTQAYYSKSNNLTIGHSRSASGHSDLADAVVTTVYQSSRIIKDNEPPQIIHNEGPFGIWVEDPPGKEKPFNFPHLVKPGDPDY